MNVIEPPITGLVVPPESAAVIELAGIALPAVPALGALTVSVVVR